RYRRAAGRELAPARDGLRAPREEKLPP
ncbi:riboflavin biosynthesis protein RibD, partial [Streptomyces sp. SID7803]|nr:riboflavin biosynthesis protein RibD [Streptomyces sp. SID7803]